MRAIGGFLPREPTGEPRGPYHAAPGLSTGRACLRLIVERVRPRTVHVPSYVCDAVLEPLRAADVAVSHYPLDRALAPEGLPGAPAAGDLYVAINYFGLQGGLMRQLVDAFGPAIVVDDSQAFFRRGSDRSWSFNSARKFFGVTDGAYLYGPGVEDFAPLTPAAFDPSHLIASREQDPEGAYRAYRRHEASLDDEPRGMSLPTAETLAAVDYEQVAARRRANFALLDERLGGRNLLRPAMGAEDIPLYYPFLSPDPLRDELIRRNIFVPSLWPELAGGNERDSWEHELATCLCPLPIDQRYDIDDMERVAAEVIGALDR